jgi:Na+/proline symporter
MILQIVIGIWVSRKVSNETDYLLAGRNLGYVLTTFGIFATWFAAEGLLSVSGEVFENGLSLITDDFLTWAIGILVLGLFFASKLRQMELVTFADLFKKRYDPTIEKITALVLIPATLFWAAGMIRAFGVTISGFSDIGITAALTIAAVSVIVYTTFGGMLADAYTDLIQGLFLIIGLILLTGFMIANGGLEALDKIPEQHFNLTNNETPFLQSVQSWMIGIFGSIIATELIARILSAKTPKVAKWSTVMGGGLFIIILGLPVLMGFAGTQLFESLEDPEQLIILQAEYYLPDVLFIFFIGALVSAILSTVDSTLLAIGSLLAHNFIIPLTKVTSKKKKLLINRVGVVFFGVVAYIIALLGSSVHDIIFLAASFGSAGIVVLYFFSFKGNWGGKKAALTAITLGTLVPLIGEYVVDFISYPYLTGFVSALVGYIVVGWFERENKTALILK